MRRSLLLPSVFIAAACGGSTASPSTPPTPVSSTGAPVPPAPTAPARPVADDPHLWLEDVTGDQALSWVKAQNAQSQQELEATPGFEELRARLLAILDSKDRIPEVVARGKWLYNFWKDEQNPRGVWRRTTLAEYRKKNPNWEVVLDLDKLGAEENENWVWSAAECLYPKYERCLVSLSRGGADAEVVREFDVTTKRFVEGGFALPEAKSSIYWKDLDTVTVATDFGEGSLTTSGYPRIVKEWKRGTPLSEAKTIFEGKETDVSVSAARKWDHGKARDLVYRAPSFFTEELFLRDGDKLVRIETPDDADVQIWNDQLLIKLRTDWDAGGRTWPAGALVAAPLADFQAGKRELAMLFEPSATTSLKSFVMTKSAVLVVELEDVKTRVSLHRLSNKRWTRARVATPAVGSVSVSAYDVHTSDDYWFTETGFTTPTTLSLGNVNKKKRAKLKQNPSFFEATGLEVTQHFATSEDGTRVPYFVVARKGMALDGGAPTILYGYGGFQLSMTPSYSGVTGAAWLERGGVYAVANIRGGGEYGPKWHLAALKQHRQRAYDDFIAVAEDLIARGVTSPQKLGIIGGSNGGLLVGVMLTQRPDLFGAIVCKVPLLDMKRYHKLLAGASWMEEYGDPDKPEEWAWLAKFSPYQNVKPGVKYPRTLFTTSTRDDRVHPGHARKMVAKMKELGADVLYYENIEGGHGGAADNKQAAYLNAIAYAFFARQLGLAN